MAVSRKLHMIVGSQLDSETLNFNTDPLSSMPAENMQSSDADLITRIPASSASITFSLAGLAQVASGFAIAGHNLPYVDGTVRVRLYEDANQTGTVNVDSQDLPVATKITLGAFRAGVHRVGQTYDESVDLPRIVRYWFDEPVAYRSGQIDITAPGATEIDIGRLFLGLAFVPNWNFSWGRKFQLIDPSEHTRTEAGGSKTEKRRAYRRFEFNLDWLDEADRERLYIELSRNGKAQDMLVSLDPDRPGVMGLVESMIAKRVNDYSDSFTHVNTYQSSLVLEEV